MAWNIVYAPPLLNTLVTAVQGALGLSGFAPNVGNSGNSATITPHTTPLNFVGAAPSLSIGSGSTAFDFFIAPNGDDNNPGTLASPWSMTALNTKMSTYSPPGVGGKRIGIIGDVGGVQTPLQFGTVGGVQTTLYSMMQALNAVNSGVAALEINGGSASNPTVLRSCTSVGVYQVGWAVFDASNPVGGAAPVGPTAIIMGQPFFAGSNHFPNNGNVTVDGVYFTNFNYAALIFGDVQTTNLTGIVIQNCKFFNGVCSTGDENPGMIFLGSAQGATVTNCLFFNGQTTGGTNHPYGMAGIASYNKSGIGSGHVVTNCTFIGVGYSIRAKDNNQWGTYSYNYMDCGLFGSATNTAGQNQNPLKGAIAPLGQTLTVHHNILVGGGYWGWGEDGALFAGAANFFNNTFYTPPAVTALALGCWFKSSSASTGPLTWHSNLVAYQTPYNNQGGPFATLSFQGGFGISASSLDFNYYKTGTSFGTNNNVNLAGWQALGFETHSIGGGSPFSGTPTSGVPTSFAITGPAATAGVGGGPCGALDGSGPIGSSLT